LFAYKLILFNLKNNNFWNLYIVKENGDWGLGIGDWGLGIGPNPQSPIPNPQSPNPHYHHIYKFQKLSFFKLNNINL
jgi:hypothetical protein